MKKDRKQQAQEFIDKFFEYYFKRFTWKPESEWKDEEKVAIIEKNHKEWITWFDWKLEKSQFIAHMKQVTWIKFWILPAFEWLWKLYWPKFIEEEKKEEENK